MTPKQKAAALELLSQRAMELRRAVLIGTVDVRSMEESLSDAWDGLWE